MSYRNKKASVDEEIDFLELIITIWRDKWKVLLITSIFIFSAYIYESSKKNNFITYVNIEKISKLDEAFYNSYNFYLKTMNYNSRDDSDIIRKLKKSGEGNLNRIDQSYLMNLYLSFLQNKKFLEKQIKSSNLIREEDFKNQIEYNDEIAEISNKIILDNENLIIRFKTQKVDEWKSFLPKLNEALNKNVNYYIQKSVNETILNQKKIIEFEIEDLEDNIKLLIEDNKKKIAKKLYFLDEQAKIARTLNIKDGIAGYDQRNIQMIDVENIKLFTGSPYYMRGYISIEKEIELIKKRKNDKTLIYGIIELEKEKIQLENSKVLDRLEKLLKKTPIYDNKNFYAGSIVIESFKVKSDQRSIFTLLFLACVVGLIFSSFLILILDSVKRRGINL